MKNIYNTSKGQLIAMWIFGIIGWLLYLAAGQDDGSGFMLFLFIFIPFALVFYTIGWKNNKKS